MLKEYSFKVSFSSILNFVELYLGGFSEMKIPGWNSHVR